jgi:hypothetical protein
MENILSSSVPQIKKLYEEDTLQKMSFQENTAWKTLKVGA